MPALGGYSQLSHGDRLEVPGRPTVVGFRGHTRGSVGPAAVVSLVPARRTTTDDTGAVTAIAAAITSIRTPACRAE
jgi:hypothetical protein